MYDASGRINILKMQKPILSCDRIYPSALMRPIHIRFALPHHHLILIGAEDIFGSQHRLPSGLHSSCRCKNIVPTVSFIQLGAFYRYLIVFIAVKDLHLITDQRHSIRLHPNHVQYALVPDTAFGNACNQIRLPVIIPERTGIDPSRAGTNIDRFRPITEGICRGTHEDSFIRHRKAYIVHSLMVSNRGCPDTTAMNRVIIY